MASSIRAVHAAYSGVVGRGTARPIWACAARICGFFAYQSSSRGAAARRGGTYAVVFTQSASRAGCIRYCQNATAPACSAAGVPFGMVRVAPPSGTVHAPSFSQGNGATPRLKKGSLRASIQLATLASTKVFCPRAKSNAARVASFRVRGWACPAALMRASWVRASTASGLFRRGRSPPVRVPPRDRTFASKVQASAAATSGRRPPVARVRLAPSSCAQVSGAFRPAFFRVPALYIRTGTLTFHGRP